MKQATAATNFGNATSLEADGDDGSGVDKSGLVRWALSGIPAGSTVQSASITLRKIHASTNAYNVYELRRGWTESQVTWQNAATASPWATAGAMGATDRGPIVGTVTGPNGARPSPSTARGSRSSSRGWMGARTRA